MKRFYRLKARQHDWLAKDHVFLFQVPPNPAMSAENARIFISALQEKVTKVGIKGVFVYGDMKVTDLGISNNVD